MSPLLLQKGFAHWHGKHSSAPDSVSKFIFKVEVEVDVDSDDNQIDQQVLV